jgi:hypothetical protein
MIAASSGGSFFVPSVVNNGGTWCEVAYGCGTNSVAAGVCHCVSCTVTVTKYQQKQCKGRRIYGMADQSSSIMAVRKQSRARGQGKIEPPQAHSPSDLLLPTRLHLLQFHHLPGLCSDFESINGLNHSLGQSCHDLKLSGNTFISWTYPEV